MKRPHPPPPPPSPPSPAAAPLSAAAESPPQRRVKRCRDTIDYERLGAVGAGQYGEVSKAKDKASGRLVALKKIKMENQDGACVCRCPGGRCHSGFPTTAIREIKYLQHIRHRNIVELVEIITDYEEKKQAAEDVDAFERAGGPGDASVFMVLEYMEYDLSAMIDRCRTHAGIRLNPADVKGLFHQLLSGVQYMHHNNIMHRDLKPANILVNAQGQLKIADLGLSREWQEKRLQYTTPVITRWYRPPELLMGTKLYSPAIDIWSCGCIFAELLRLDYLVQGATEADQLDKIFALLGTPKPAFGQPQQFYDNPEYQFDVWPDVAEVCPDWATLAAADKPQPRRLQERFDGRLHKTQHKPAGGPALSYWHTLDLLERMLHLDPKRRVKAHDALDMAYFWVEPRKTEPHELPKFPTEGMHDLEMRQRHEAERARRREEAQRAHQARQASHKANTAGGHHGKP